MTEPMTALTAHVLVTSISDTSGRMDSVNLQDERSKTVDATLHSTCTLQTGIMLCANIILQDGRVKKCACGSLQATEAVGSAVVVTHTDGS